MAETKLEDLRKWFGKGKKGDWVRVGTDGEIKGQCAREPGEGKPKCMPRSKAHSMTKKDRASSARRKRRQDPMADRPGTGNKPIMVKTDKKESVDMNEKASHDEIMKDINDFLRNNDGSGVAGMSRRIEKKYGIGPAQARSMIKTALQKVKALPKTGPKRMGRFPHMNEETAIAHQTPYGTVTAHKRDTKGMRGKQDGFKLTLKTKSGKTVDLGSHPKPTKANVMSIVKNVMQKESEQLDELSPKTIDSYRNKRTMGTDGRSQQDYLRKARAHRELGNDAEADRLTKRANKIGLGKHRAVARHHAQHGRNVDMLKHKSVKRVPQAYKDQAQRESVDLEEKNVPTNPALWAKFKAQAKAKFDVYPSAYANGWAAKKYKAAGGSWKKESVEMPEQKTFWDVREGSCGTMNAQTKKDEKPPFTPTRKVGVKKDRFGNVVKDKNRAKHLAKLAMRGEDVELGENQTKAHLRAKSKLLGGASMMDLERAGNNIRAYAKKGGGSDKKDFDTAADYVISLGRLTDANKVGKVLQDLQFHVGMLDTDVRDKIKSMLPTGLKKKV